MRARFILPILSILFLFLLGLLSPRAVNAQSADAARTLALINQARQTGGLPPLAVNPQLTAAAQAHADDMRQHGVGIGHLGTDGSTPGVRMIRAGYSSYSWGPFTGEIWAAWQSVDISFNWWMGDKTHRDEILRAGYRELGIGVAYLDVGYPVIVVDFGAQPNVLPVFIGGNGPNVIVTLTNEIVTPDGDGPNVIGRAVQVDLSRNADMSGARTYQFAQTIVYTGDDGRPVDKLYARFHDAQGRTVVSATTSGGPVIMPASPPTGTPTVQPSNTATRTKAPKPTRTKTRTPTRAPTQTRTPLPTATATEEWVMLPTPTEGLPVVVVTTEPDATVTPQVTRIVESASASTLSGFAIAPVARVMIATAGVIASLMLILAIWQLRNGR